MTRSVLIVDKDAARRGEIAAACVARGAMVREADDPFSAMAALGQHSFDVLCAFAGPRHLSLRGLFQLAKRKRQDILIYAFVLPEDRAAVQASFDDEARVLDLAAGAPALADALTGASAGPSALDEAAMDEPTFRDPPSSEPTLSVEPDLELGDEEAAPPPPGPAPVEAALDDDAPIADTPPAGFDVDVDGFDDDFRTPAPAGAWDAGSGAESDLVELSALASASGEGAPLPTGAETLIVAFARELTGTLVLRDGDRRWCLYLYGGEPAWVDPPGGDTAVFERLVARGMLPADAQPEPVPDGHLLASLVEQGGLSRGDAQVFMRQLLFDAAIDIAALDSCGVEVVEAPAFLQTPPPFRVNPFGLVLESRRRRMSPDELLATSRELEDAPVVASGKLDKVYGKVAPFLRGIDVRSILEHGSTLRGFREAAGVDAMLATQLVLALEAVGLVRIERAPAGA